VIKTLTFITKVKKHSKYKDYWIGRIASVKLKPFVDRTVRVKITLLKEVEA
jgi:ABC-type transporter Mla subunit MlaD